MAVTFPSMQPLQNTKRLLDHSLRFNVANNYSHSSRRITCAASVFPNWKTVTLYNPLKDVDNMDASATGRALLVYLPGMDCMGMTLRPQLPALVDAGYDIRCVYIPDSDRSSWQELVAVLSPLLTSEVRRLKSTRQLTLVGESFGACLALRLVQAVPPDIVSRLVLINSATNFFKSNFIASFGGLTGLLGILPLPLYDIAKKILLPVIVKQDRVSNSANEAFLSCLTDISAECAAWRLTLLNDNSNITDKELQEIHVPTLIIASAKDRLLLSIEEGARLQGLLPNSKRIILPNSGHTPLMEESVDLGSIMKTYGFLSDSNDAPSWPTHIVADNIMDEVGQISGPWRILTSPFVSGVDNLPNPLLKGRRPILFVGNHSTFGMYDTFVIFYELFLRGFPCRALAHPGHWVTPVGSLFERYGNVKANKFATYKLLKEGENLLLFPGGAREVCKGKDEKYKLLWKPTADFVRMAAQFGAIIVPFGAIGADDAYRIMWDSDEILSSPFGPLVENMVSALGLSLDSVQPISALPFSNIPSLIPVPSTIERIYIHFADPIDTSQFCQDPRDRSKLNALYVTVKQRVEESIVTLMQIRENDPERETTFRLWSKLGRLLPRF